MYPVQLGVSAECRGFESHSRQLNFSKKKWAVLSAVELFALHLCCCSSVIHVCGGFLAVAHVVHVNRIITRRMQCIVGSLYAVFRSHLAVPLAL